MEIVIVKRPIDMTIIGLSQISIGRFAIGIRKGGVGVPLRPQIYGYTVSADRRQVKTISKHTNHVLTTLLKQTNLAGCLVRTHHTDYGK